jgi:hypothetical protein
LITRFFVALLGCFLLLAVCVPTAAHAEPELVPPSAPLAYTDGFASLSVLVGVPMGIPVELPHVNDESGYVEQLTSTGLAYYSPDDNLPAFTDGWSHWALDNTGVLRIWQGAELLPPEPTPTPVVVVPTDVPSIIRMVAARYGLPAWRIEQIVQTPLP